MIEFPVIHYDTHPGFAALGLKAREPNLEADRIVAEIDAELESISSSGMDVQGRNAEFDRVVAPRIAALTKLVEKDLDADSPMPAFWRDAMEIARRSLRADVISQRAVTMRNSDAASLPIARANLLGEFRRDGFAVLPSSSKLARRIWRQTVLERFILRRKARREPQNHAAIPLHPSSPGGATLIRALEEQGLLEITSAYMGRPMEFLYASLDFAHSGQGWYKNCYADVGLPTSKTAYMHVDADHDILKAMFYLTDCSAENGPFGFLKGSHLWKRSPTVVAVQKGFDQAQATRFELQPDELDFKSGYYRPRFRERSYRMGTLSLPPLLRGSTHFGDDVLDDSDLSKALLGSEVSFTCQAGTFVLFDGSQGIHRGAMVRAGERWAIQIGFRARRSGESKPSVSALRGRLSYMKKGLSYLVNAVKGH